MANKLYADTEIKGKLDLEGSFTVVNPTKVEFLGNGSQNDKSFIRFNFYDDGKDGNYLFYTYLPLGNESYPRIETWVSINPYSTEIFAKNDATIYLTASGDDGSYSTYNQSQNGINIASTGGIYINGKENLNLKGPNGGLEFSIAPDSYCRLWDSKDKFQITTTGFRGFYSNLSTSTLTANRRHNLPDEDGTIATREWVLQKLDEILNSQAI